MLSLELGWEVLGAKMSSLGTAVVGLLMMGVGGLGVNGVSGLVCSVEWPGPGIMLSCRRLGSER